MKALKSLLVDAKSNIPYYREMLSKYNLEMSAEEAFADLPIVNKKIIKSDYRSFVSENISTELLNNIVYTDDYVYGKNKVYEYNGDKYISDFTSGTTGTPFVAIKSIAERNKLVMDLWRLRNRISHVTPKELINILFGEGLEQFKHFDKATRIRKELEFISSSGYSWLALTLFKADQYCDYIAENKQIKLPKLKVVEHTGSYVSEEDKNRIEKGMNVLFTNNYGCREGWTIAYTCKYFHLHLNDDGMLVELLDDDGNIIEEADKVGSIVFTTLKLRNMPFIRYEIGDYAFYEEGECECGCKSKRIKLIPGRIMIKGTELYGDKFFKFVLFDLSKKYGMFRYGSINIIQKATNKFIVNTTELKENQLSFEKYFVTVANELFGHGNNEYFFTYDDNINCKSIFVVGF
jgi:phenylacetate-CoA ligase